MLHPSYQDLIQKVNSEVEPGEQPVVQSRYSIVLATAKRARQLIDGDEAMVPGGRGKKPLSLAVQELYEGKVKILSDSSEDDDAEETEEEYLAMEQSNAQFEKANAGASEA
ncbi:MAG: DNA-directed RNA polymerase subunit omega [Clostridiales bacterium]|nr:DNA-directed RNA polymerase subunit omega [Clostridiales bacterium]